MTVAVLLWGRTVAKPRAAQLNFPLTVYLGNFAFAMVMSLAFGFWVPVLLGILLGVIPAVLCWRQSYLLSEKSAAAEASLKPSVRVGASAN